MKNTLKTAILILFFGLTISCGNKNKETKNTDLATANKILIKTEPAQKIEFEQKQEFVATVESEVKNNIAPSVPIRIKKIYFDVGDMVLRGQKLVQMDDANLNQLKFQLENREKDFKRLDELYKIGGISKAEWEAAQTALDVQKTSYNNILENTQLLAPISGIVTQKNYDDGDMYTSSKPILTIEQISPAKLVINVAEQYYTKVKKGLKAEVKFDVYGNEPFTGIVDLVHPTIDPSSRTFAVELKVGNVDRRIKPGMFGRVTLNFGKIQGIAIPDLAIKKQSGTNYRYAFVVKNGIVESRKLGLGVQIKDRVEIISGISEGEEVAVTKISQLEDGTPVEVKND